jgi:hypothetical protein
VASIGPTLGIGKSPAEQSFEILAGRSPMDPYPDEDVLGFYRFIG